MKTKQIVVRKTKMKTSLGSKIFDVCNAIFMCSLIIVILIPLLHVVSASFSDPSAYVRHEGLLLHPVDFCLMHIRRWQKTKISLLDMRIPYLSLLWERFLVYL